MLFALDICVNKKAPLTQCALGSQPPPPPPPQKHNPFFCQDAAAPAGCR